MLENGQNLETVGVFSERLVCRENEKQRHCYPNLTNLDGI